MKKLFSGKLQTAVSNGEGLVAGMNMPLVLPLTGIHKGFVREHFQKKGFSEEDINAKIQEHTVWYGVIDGEYRTLALHELIDEDPQSWGSFLLLVTVLEGGHPLEEYEKLAVTRNELQADIFHIATTLFDRLKRMKLVIARLTEANSGKAPKAPQVTKLYDGSTKTLTLRQTATTAARLDMRVIETIGSIMHSEQPDVLASRAERKGKGHKTREEMLGEVDCRIYRSFLTLTTIKSSKEFMNATAD